MSQALRAADAWGHALGELDPVPEERLALLLQTCASAHGQPGQQPTNAGEGAFAASPRDRQLASGLVCVRLRGELRQTEHTPGRRRNAQHPPRCKPIFTSTHRRLCPCFKPRQASSCRWPCRW